MLSLWDITWNENGESDHKNYLILKKRWKIYWAACMLSIGWVCYIHEICHSRHSRFWFRIKFDRRSPVMEGFQEISSFLYTIFHSLKEWYFVASFSLLMDGPGKWKKIWRKWPYIPLQLDVKMISVHVIERLNLMLTLAFLQVHYSQSRSRWN